MGSKLGVEAITSHGAGARVERDDRAAVFAERRDRRALGGRVERRDDFVALPALALQLVEDRLQVRGARFAVQSAGLR